jgi:hypothetical protein
MLKAPNKKVLNAVLIAVKACLNFKIPNAVARPMTAIAFEEPGLVSD